MLDQKYKNVVLLQSGDQTTVHVSEVTGTWISLDQSEESDRMYFKFIILEMIHVFAGVGTL